MMGGNGYTFAMVTVSDKGSKGEREDGTGPALIRYLEEKGFHCVHYEVIPDELDLISNRLTYLADDICPHVVFTNGGTGFSVRDVTPEATKEVITREIPGFPEVMRGESMKRTPRAMLSRGISGIRRETIIINLPGSPKAAVENLSFIMEALPHGIDILIGSAKECATEIHSMQ